MKNIIILMLAFLPVFVGAQNNPLGVTRPAPKVTDTVSVLDNDLALSGKYINSAGKNLTASTLQRHSGWEE